MFRPRSLWVDWNLINKELLFSGLHNFVHLNIKFRSNGHVYNCN